MWKKVSHGRNLWKHLEREENVTHLLHKMLLKCWGATIKSKPMLSSSLLKCGRLLVLRHLIYFLCRLKEKCFPSKSPSVVGRDEAVFCFLGREQLRDVVNMELILYFCFLRTRKTYG